MRRTLHSIATLPMPRQQYADGGVVQFGSRGVAGLRDLIPKMQAMGYPQTAPASAPADASGAARLRAMIPQMEAMGFKQQPQYLARGGHVRGPGTGTSDSIPAMLSDGEFVVPADTVRKVGVRRLQDLVDMTHAPTGKAPVPERYADGGLASRNASRFDVNAWAQQQEQTRAADTQASLAAGQAAIAENDARAQEAAAAKRSQAVAPPSPGSAPAPASSSLDQRVSQIPTGGLKAPAADGSQNSWSNTETGRNLSNLASALPGSLGGAIPAVVKTGGAISGGIDAATRLLNAGAGAAAISALPGAAGAQTATTSAAGAGRGVVNPPAVNPSAPMPASPPAATAISTPSSTSPATTNDVTRVGNSYSGNNVAGDITVNGRAPGGGYMNTGNATSGTGQSQSPVGMSVAQAQSQGMVGGQIGYNPAYDQRLTGAQGTPNSQNMAAADNLAATQQQGARARLLAAGSPAAPSAPGVASPTVLNSSNSWQARNDLRNLEVSAKSITNRPEWSGSGMARFRGGQVGGSPDVAAYQAALANDLALKAGQSAADVATMRENAGLQREGMQQSGETQRTDIRAQGVSDANQIARGRLRLEEIASGYANRTADRMDRAQTDLENANTPEAQKSARERLMALAGKAPQDEWAVQVTPTTKNADGSTTQGSIYRYNKTTGETARVDAGQQMDITKDPRAVAIRDNPKLSYEQKKAALAQMGF